MLSTYGKLLPVHFLFSLFVFIAPGSFQYLKTRLCRSMAFEVDWLIPGRFLSNANEHVSVGRKERLCYSSVLWSVGIGLDRSIFAMLSLQ